ncbi:MAG: tripartite tricarboxylate transporter TctB family protein [Rhodobacteraceae bacterium]|nr:tripartite tricarboxylate transporter TctB family protein [Paracoccaceae bacterium]
MSSQTDPRALFSHSDFWIGLVLMVFGGVAASMAWSFDPISRSYPLALSLLLSVAGVLLILKTAIRQTPSVHFGLATKVSALCAVVLVLWIAALGLGLGFVLPTLLMQFAFLWICGLRPVGKAVAFSVLITAVGYSVFVFVLNVRLPEGIAPWIM